MSKLSDALRGTNSHAEATQVIAQHNPSKADLRAAAQELGSHPADGNKAQIADGLANHTGGARAKFSGLYAAFGGNG